MQKCIMNVKWDDIRYVLALSREGTLSNAGNSLGVNYTTVARRIQALEETMHVKLFEQTGKGYLPTEAAQAVLADAETIETKFHAIHRTLFNHEDKICGELRVTFSPSIGKALVLPYMQEFQQMFPDIDLVFISSSSIANLGVRDADIAIRASDVVPDHLIGLRVAKIGYALYGSKNYCQQYPDLDASGSRLLTLMEPNYQDHALHILKRHPTLKSGMQVSSFTTLEDATVNNAGFAILPSFIGNKNSKLKRIMRIDALQNWDIWLLSHPDYRQSLRLKAFKDFMRQKLLNDKSLISGD